MLNMLKEFMPETGGAELGAEAYPANLLPLPNLLSELLTVMSRVRPEDLSAVEVAALLAILDRADSRVIGQPCARPGLRIVRSYAVGSRRPISR